MRETTTSDAVLARLEALTARLDEQAAEITQLKAENARLTAVLAAPTVAVAPPAPATTSRRGMLRRVVGASAAALGGATDAGAAPRRGSNATFSYRVVARGAGRAGSNVAPPPPPDLSDPRTAPRPPQPARPSGASDERRQR